MVFGVWDSPLSQPRNVIGVVLMAGSSWSILFTPVLSGAIIVVFVGLLINNLAKERKYPTFWV
ncbi:HPP family protein [Paenibacillus sp. TAF58]